MNVRAPVFTLIDHWLDSEHHPGLHTSDSLVLRVMGNIRRTMKHRVNAVTSVRADGLAPICCGNRLAGKKQFRRKVESM